MLLEIKSSANSSNVLNTLHCTCRSRKAKFPGPNESVLELGIPSLAIQFIVRSADFHFQVKVQLLYSELRH